MIREGKEEGRDSEKCSQGGSSTNVMKRSEMKEGMERMMKIIIIMGLNKTMLARLIASPH